MISSEQLTAIRTFIQAAKSENFSDAGLKLGLTSSAVGKAVARLETRLGARLFHRTTRQMTLTEDGALLLQACQRAFSELEAVEATLTSRTREPAGRLRVSLPELLGRKVIMPILLELSQTYSMLTFDVSFSNRLTDLVEDGIDLAVRIGNVGNSADLVARRLGTQNIVMCASPDYLARRGTPKVVSDLAGHDCITYSRSDGRAPWLLADETGAVGQVDVSGTFSVGSYDAIYDCVLRGFGVAQLPEWLVAEALKQGSVVTVMPASSPKGLPIQAVWPHRRDMNRRTRVLTDLLIRHFRQFWPPLGTENDGARLVTRNPEDMSTR